MPLRLRLIPVRRLTKCLVPVVTFLICLSVFKGPIFDKSSDQRQPASRDSGKSSSKNGVKELNIAPVPTDENVKFEKYVDTQGGKEKIRLSFQGIDGGSDPDGPGEYGRAVLLEGEERELGDKLSKKWFMDVVVSDKISMDRKIPDTRERACKSIKYDAKLPTASVVIIFHNEAWSPLLRTVHSVINRSPPDVLLEVILLDDFSDREDLKSSLETYIERWKDKVKLVRVASRQGLIRARIEGAKAASGDVLVFLDSHCEANYGWLEPLVQRIKDVPKAVLVPSIDMISDKTFAYFGGPTTTVGGFWWSLHFKWDPIPKMEQQRRQSSVDPIRSPTMPGGLFAMGRKYFFDMGAYDSGMDIWGGENLEISFRTWMCGGVLEFIPCSHVGHVFRAGHPYNMTAEGPLAKDVHGKNSKRLAEVWMDDYKRLYYHHRQDLRHAEVGDLTERHQLRKRLKCHDFKWYLDNLVPYKFIPDEGVYAFGSVRNPSTGLCLDTMQRDEKTVLPVGLFHCQGGGSSAQFFSLSKDGRLRREESCSSVRQHAPDGGPSRPVSLYPCGSSNDRVDPGHIWRMKQSPGQLVHQESGLCLDTKYLSSSKDVLVRPCEDESLTQVWQFEHVMEQPPA